MDRKRNTNFECPVEYDEDVIRFRTEVEQSLARRQCSTFGELLDPGLPGSDQRELGWNRRPDRPPLILPLGEPVALSSNWGSWQPPKNPRPSERS